MTGDDLADEMRAAFAVGMDPDWDHELESLSRQLELPFEEAEDDYFFCLPKHLTGVKLA